MARLRSCWLRAAALARTHARIGHTGSCLERRSCARELQPLQLRDFILVAFWLGVKIVAGLVIGAALFETVGLVVGLIALATGG